MSLFLNHTAHLYWFSGAGNTLLAAIAMAERLREHGVTVELRAIERFNPREIDPNVAFGIAFPTHCFTLPEIVRLFAEQLPNVAKTPAFMLNTVGVTSCGGVRGPLKRILTEKGFVCVGAKEVVMPDSFFAFLHGRPARWLIRRALKRVHAYADLLVTGQTSWRRIPLVTDWYAAFLRRFFACRDLLAPSFRYPTVVARQKTCIRCGLCAKHCPVSALSMQSLEKVAPKKENHSTNTANSLKAPPKPNLCCTLCLRCVAVCPTNAMRHRLLMLPPYRAETSKQLRHLFDERD